MKPRMGLPGLRNLAAGPRTWHSKARAPMMCCCSAPFLGELLCVHSAVCRSLVIC